MFKRVRNILGSRPQAGLPGRTIPTGAVGMPKPGRRPAALPSLAAGLALVAGLAACGQKGPLYLPNPNEPVKAAKPRPAPASAPAQSSATDAPARAASSTQP
jgi:predicted small lipoprotein YifL